MTTNQKPAMREYRTVDKSTWGTGPWQGEPDKAQWRDEATGLDCLIHRGPSGALCGYVGVPESHPLYGKGYSECIHRCGESWCEHSPGAFLDVHGGLTYAAACQESDDETTGICHVPEPGQPDQVWWFGFDCAHSGDLCPKRNNDWREREFVERFGYVYRDLAYVREQIASLASQLAALPAPQSPGAPGA